MIINNVIKRYPSYYIFIINIKFYIKIDVFVGMTNLNYKYYMCRCFYIILILIYIFKS